MWRNRPLALTLGLDFSRENKKYENHIRAVGKTGWGDLLSITLTMSMFLIFQIILPFPPSVPALDINN